jgi:hypothetical protein
MNLTEDDQEVKFDLAKVTNPLDFEQVFRLVQQTEGLNKIQQNLREHRSLDQ